MSKDPLFTGIQHLPFIIFFDVYNAVKIRYKRDVRNMTNPTHDTLIFTDNKKETITSINGINAIKDSIYAIGIKIGGGKKTKKRRQRKQKTHRRRKTNKTKN